MTKGYILNGIDLAQFPSEITLKHGKDGGREWWEWWERMRSKDRKKGIVIQRPTQKLPFVIFFFRGETIRTLELPLNARDKAKGVVSKTFATHSIEKAIEVLARLGIKAERRTETR